MRIFAERKPWGCAGEETPTARPTAEAAHRDVPIMTRRTRIAFNALRSPSVACTAALLGAALGAGTSAAATYPITAEQRSTAQRTAQAGVALSELLPNAPDSYTVKPNDTLWGI